MLHQWSLIPLLVAVFFLFYFFYEFDGYVVNVTGSFASRNVFILVKQIMVGVGGGGWVSRYDILFVHVPVDELKYNYLPTSHFSFY